MAVFVATVETGSMAAAARALELSTAVVGQQIQQLEAQLGTALFERAGRWQRLSATGLAYHQQCRSILELVRGAESGAQTTARQAGGKLRLRAPVLFGSRELAPALADFLREHPRIQLDLVLDDRATEPESADFDLLFHRGEPEPQPGFEWLPLARHALCMVASPAYVQAHGRPERPAELVRHACLGFLPSEGSMPPAEAEDWEGRADVEAEAELAPRVQVQANSALALQALVLHGAGIAVLPQDLVAEDLAAGRLLSLLPDCPLGVETLGLLLRREGAESLALAVLIDWVLRRWGLEAQAVEPAAGPHRAEVPDDAQPAATPPAESPAWEDAAEDAEGPEADDDMALDEALPDELPSEACLPQAAAVVEADEVEREIESAGAGADADEDPVPAPAPAAEPVAAPA